MSVLSPGTQIGYFTIGQLIGEGGMGTVYQAYKIGSKDRLAIKVLRPELAQDAEYRQRFEREANILQALKHPNIVPVRAWGEENGLMYIVMDFIPGLPLETLRRENFTPMRALEILTPVAQALDYAHAHGVVHRDVKPGNIIVLGSSQTLSVYLLDFGLGKAYTSLSLTQADITLGTPQYMAPEQALGDPVTGLTDIYSLGVVTYELLLNRLPFDGASPEEIAIKQIDEHPPLPSNYHPDFPLPLEDVLLRGLAKEPEQRFQTAERFMTAFAQALAKIPPEARRVCYYVAKSGSA
jgi:serine/threonine protein kinase